ncbi:MAG: peroxiredoxin [Aquiluna sp.]
MSNQHPPLSPGEMAPAFKLPNQDGKLMTNQEIFSQNTILYFFPSAGTPGCTKEAADFQDHLPEFSKYGYQVVGVSPDSAKRLKSFEDSHELTFTLLSDSDLVAHQAYGAFGEKNIFGRIYKGVLRSTIVVEAGGRVREAMYNVKATGHIPNLLRIIAN